MSALTSLLVRDRVVPVSKIEEALQHQVLAGGDIETILLEMNLVPEDVLSAYRAALYGLLPATREELMKASRDALRRVPRELSRGAGFVPLWIEGRSLVVAACEPPGPELEQQIRALLGCELTVRIVTQPRLAAGLAHHYGYELDARMRRLTEALRKREPGVIPYVRPPSPSMKPSMRAAAANPFRDPAGPNTQEYPALGEGGQADGADAEDSPAPESTSEPPDHPENAPMEPDESGMMTDVARAEINAGVKAIPPEAPHAADDAETSGERPRDRAHPSTIPPSSISGHIARAVRGPLSAERAMELLYEANRRDDALFVLLRYAQQFFDFVGVFSIGKEGARGRLSHGARLSQELMEQVIVPLKGGGLVARAVRDLRPVVGDLSAGDEERVAAALLNRPSGRPGIAIPIVLGARAVLLVYGDREGEGIALDDAAPVLAIAPAVSETLRRLIMESKTLQRASNPPPADLNPSAALSVSPPRAASVPAPEEARGSAPSVEARPKEAAGSVLTAVDLEAVARPSSVLAERRKDTAPIHSAALGTRAAERREAARGRVFGIPRSAPPPPLRESLGPGAPGAGTYSYVAPTGALIEEKVRTTARLQSAPPGPLGISEAREPAKAKAQTEDAPREPQRTNGAANQGNGAVRPARAPSSPQLPAVPEPSMIIDMGEQVKVLVESLLKAQPAQEPIEIAELLNIGEAALPVLLQHFPGPLWFDRKERHKRRPRGRDISAVARAIVAFGESAAPYVASRLGSADKDICYYALMVAGEIAHPDLLDAVTKRALDADDELRAVALDVLRAYKDLPQFAQMLQAISELSARAGKDPRRQRLALEALGELRDRRTLRTLLARLSDPSEAVVQAAHKALVTLTGQDFGLAQRKWEAWAEQWGSAHRVEWLMESLLHGDESVRSLAGDELKQLTQQYFGYHPALPRRDRELAQRKYREWWEAEGRATFGV